MKQLIILIGILAAGVFGYTLEPRLRSQLTLPAAPISPIPPTAAESPSAVEKQ